MSKRFNINVVGGWDLRPGGDAETAAHRDHGEETPVVRELTEAQEKALRIVRDHGPIAPARFSELMWPDSPARHRVYKCGPKGSTRGSGLWQAAGGFLGKLRCKGWVEPKFSECRPIRRLGYILTAEGLRVLEQAGVA